MNVYLKNVEDEFDRRELRYLELVDCFGVHGVDRRLRELRAALANNEGEAVIRSKRRFITDLSEWDYQHVAKVSVFSWSALALSRLPIGI